MPQEAGELDGVAGGTGYDIIKVLYPIARPEANDVKARAEEAVEMWKRRRYGPGGHCFDLVNEAIGLGYEYDLTDWAEVPPYYGERKPGEKEHKPGEKK